MAFKMGAVIVMVFILATIAAAIDVNITGEWKPEQGWEVTCLWETLANDTLQSVRLYYNGEEHMIYWPEKNGVATGQIFSTSNEVFISQCFVTVDKGRKGKCIMMLKPLQPPVDDFTYTCEVSGERPWFRINRKDYLVRVLVPPSDAELTSAMQEQASAVLVALNCSSAGLPAPRLEWTVGNEKVPEVSSGHVWNATSKLWHVWSYYTYTRSDKNEVSCTPKVNLNNDTFTGHPAVFNEAVGIH